MKITTKHNIALGLNFILPVFIFVLLTELASCSSNGNFSLECMLVAIGAATIALGVGYLIYRFLTKPIERKLK